MNEITRTKRLEVAHYYLLGYTYREIEEETGISHGSIANIVSEIENSSLTIPGTSFDQINDLRQPLMRCNRCGTLYQVNQRVLWIAQAIESGKPLSQSITDFMRGREKCIIKHFKDRRS